MNLPLPAHLKAAPNPTRRSFLEHAAGGIGGVALATLLNESQAKDALNPLAHKAGHHAAKAKAVIQIFCSGALSHIDTWDYKPELLKRTGKPFDPDGKMQFFASKPGNCQGSWWPFQQYGECGRWISDLLPRLAGEVDEMAFVHSMRSKSALHGPAMFMANSGFVLPGFPSMGSWVTYGLGSECDNLPAFVVLPDPRGLPPGGAINWGAGFLPAVHQGTTIQSSGQTPIADLFPPNTYENLRGEREIESRLFLQTLNRAHAASRPDNSELEARIAAYELAARLQLSAPETTDLSAETGATKKLYNIDHEDIGPFGRQCLLARRLVQRGVRFVQIFCGAENTTAKKVRPNWDSHEDIVRDHGYWGAVLDGGAAALLADLRSHGLLESTLVICTSEFGRQPAAQGSGKGRDHNPDAFTVWMAGGGIKGGSAYGSTDELGGQAVEHPSYCYDVHATALHLLGLDHERLTYYNNGVQRRLTDVHGHVIREILA